MWKKVEKDNLEFFCNQGTKADVNLFKEFVINNGIEYILTTMIKGPLYDFMKKGGVNKEEGNRIWLSSRIPNLEHDSIYKNDKNQIFIVSNSYSTEEKIQQDFDNWNNGKYKLTILGIEKSWYFPGGTVAFVITLKDVEVK